MNVAAHLLNAPHKARLRVEDFLLLNDGGAFADYAKTELIDGDIYVMNAQYTRHALAKFNLAMAIAKRLEEMDTDLKVIPEVSVRLSPDSMPEPDIVLARWNGQGPVPGETVALLVEISDTTLAVDLGRKAELYAAAGIPEYWVVDLNENRVLMHEHPGPSGYAGQLDILFGNSLASATIKGLEIEGGLLQK